MTSRPAGVIGGLAVLIGLVSPAAGKPSPEHPVIRRGVDEIDPAGNGDWLAWSENRRRTPEAFDVFARATGGQPFQVNPKSKDGYAGGIDGTLLVYTLIPRGGDTDLRLVDLASGDPRPLPGLVNSRHHEAEATLSGQWLLYARERSGGRYLKQILLANLSTGTELELDRIRRVKQFLLAGQVNGDFAVWHRCGARGPCDVFRRTISTEEVTEVPNPNDALQYTPGVAPDGTVYYFRSGPGCGRRVELRRYPSGGGSDILVDFPPRTDGADAFVYVDQSSVTHVLYGRVRCGRLRDPSDIYQVTPG